MGELENTKKTVSELRGDMTTKYCIFIGGFLVVLMGFYAKKKINYVAIVLKIAPIRASLKT